MGEVYRARDTKLDRDVAIKVLPEELAADTERGARFEREAKLVASLNHPNIGGIYGLEESGGVKALVLELVEGPTLADRIAQGPIPIDEALPIARQIADALEAGHEAGIVHRDLKPANVKVRDDGTVKVLDYGLAKGIENDALNGGDSELSQSPTLTRQGTQLGVILGTAPYMSPEQAKGERVDKRTDIFAFGAVVYEMLTGKRAFAGEDVSETLAHVMMKDPRHQTPLSISPDGTSLLIEDRGASVQYDVALVALPGGGAAELLVHSEFNETDAAFAPGGRFFAYASDESGRYEIYVRPFPNVEDGPWQVSRDGGVQPLWSRDGREPFYASPDGKLMGLSVRTGDDFTYGNPEVVVAKPHRELRASVVGYDISPDGRRFLMLQDVESSTTELFVVLNWAEEL